MGRAQPTDAAASLPKRPWWRRLLGLALRLLAGLLVGVLLLVLLVFALLQTRWAHDLVRDEVLGLVNPLIAGSLEVGAIEGDWLRHLTLVDVAILAPDGQQAAHVERLALRYDLTDLFDQRVLVRRLEVQSPQLTLQGPRGEILIAEAFAPAEKEESPEEPDTEASSWQVELVELALTGGTVRLSAESEIALRALSIRGSAQVGERVQWRDVQVEGALTVDPPALLGPESPLAGPVGVTGQLRGDVQTPRLDLEIATAAGPLALVAEATLRPDEPLRYELTLSSQVREGTVEPLHPGRLVTALDPRSRAHFSLSLRGEGLPHEDGQAWVTLLVEDLALPDLLVPRRLVLDLWMDRGRLALAAAAEGPESQRAELWAEAPWLPPGPVAGGVRVEDLEIADWAPLFGQPDLRGHIERVQADGALALDAEGLLGATGTFSAALRGLRLPVPGAGLARSERIQLRGQLAGGREEAWEGRLALTSGATSAAGARLRALELELRGRERSGDFTLRGPLRVEGLRIPELGEIPRAELSAELTLNPSRGRYGGEIGLRVPRMTLAGRELRDLVLALRARPNGQAELTVETRLDSLEASLALSGRLPRRARDPLEARLDAFSLQELDSGAGLRARPGAELRYAPSGAASLRKLHLRGSGALDGAALDVDATLARGQLTGGLRLRGVDLAAWEEAIAHTLGHAPGDEGALRGELSGRLHLSGSARRPRVQARLRLQEGALGEITPLGALLQLDLADERATVSLDATWAKGVHVTASGEIPLSLSLHPDHLRAHIPPEAPLSLDLTLSQVDLYALAEWLPAPPGAPLRGLLNGSLALRGSLRAPQGIAALRVSGLQLDTLRDAQLEASLELRPERTEAHLWLERGGERPLSIDLALPVDLPALLREGLPGGDWLAQVRRLPLTAELHIERLRLGEIPGLKLGAPRLAGSVITSHLQLGGSLAEPELRGRLEVAPLPLGKEQGSAELRLESEGPDLKLGGRLTGAEARLVSLSGTVPGIGRLSGPGGLSAVARDPALAVQVQVKDLSIATLSEMLPVLGERLSDLLDQGLVGADVSVAGSAAGPRVAALVRARSLSQPLPGALPRFATGLHVALDLGKDRTSLVLGVEQRDLGGELVATVESALGSGALLREGLSPEQIPLTGRVKTRDFDLRGLSSFLPAVFGPSRGHLDVALEIGGTLARPSATGHLEARFDELVLTGVGLHRQDLAIRVDVSPEALLLRPLHLDDDGKLDVELVISTPSWEPAEMLLLGSVGMERFRIAGRDDLRLRTSGALQIAGSLDEPFVTGDLSLDEGHVSPQAGRSLHPIGAPADVSFVRSLDFDEATRQALADRVRATASPKLDIRVKLPERRLRIANDMLDLFLGGALHIKSSGGAVSIEGRVVVLEGTVELYGRRFVIEEDSQAVFGGGAELNPGIDVRARYPIADVDLSPIGLLAGPDSHILVTVSGSAEAPRIDLSSAPMMDETNILSILLTDAPVSAGGTSEGEALEGQATRLFVGLATGQLTSLIRRDLKMDVLKIEAGEEGLQDARLRVGKRITRDLLVLYEANLGADEYENQNEIHVQYRLTRLLQLESRFGDRGAGGIDLLLRWRW